MSESLLVQFSGLLLLLFTAIASIDGLYLHLYKYRLHEQPESIFEHKLHTVNAVLFPFTVVCLFTPWGVGWVLWAGVLLTAVTFGAELRDVWCEPASRAKVGGLTGFESFLHFAMGLLRCAYSCLIFASRPAAAWQLNAEPLSSVSLVQIPFWLQSAAWIIAGTGVGVALLHVVLMQRGQKTAARKMSLQRA